MLRINGTLIVNWIIWLSVHNRNFIYDNNYSLTIITKGFILFYYTSIYYVKIPSNVKKSKTKYIPT